MATTLHDLIVRISGDTSALFKEVNKSVKEIDKAVKPMETLGKTLTTRVTAPLMAVGAAFGAMVVSASSAADELETMSDKTGLSLQTLQELRYVASQTNVDFGSLTQAAVMLGRNLVEGSEGSRKMAAIIEGLGIQTRDATGQFLSMDQLFPQVIEKLAGMQDVTQRNVLAMELFGRGGAEIIPMLNAGSAGIAELTAKAHAMGLVMGDQSVKDLANFNDQLAAVKLQFQAVWAQIASSFMPLIEERLMPFIEDSVVPAFRRFAEFVGKVIDAFRSLPPGVQDAILAVTGLVVAIGPLLLAVAQGIKVFGVITAVISGISLPIAGVIAAVVLLTTAWVSNWGHIQERTQYVIDILKAGFNYFVLALEADWERLKLAFYSAINYILQVIEPITRFLPESWRAALDQMKAATEQKIADIHGNLQSLGEKWAGVTQSIEAAGERYRAVMAANAISTDENSRELEKFRRWHEQASQTVETKTRPTIQGLTKDLDAQAEKWAETAGEMQKYYASLVLEATKAAKSGVISGSQALSYAAKATTEKYGTEGLKAVWDNIRKTYYAADYETQRRMFEFETGVATPPKLALGGIIQRPVLLSDLATGVPAAIAGEAGPEAIVPAAAGAGGPVTIIIEMDGKPVARGIAPHLTNLIRIKTGVA